MCLKIIAVDTLLIKKAYMYTMYICICIQMTTRYPDCPTMYTRLSSRHTPKEPGNEAIYTLAAIQER